MSTASRKKLLATPVQSYRHADEDMDISMQTDQDEDEIYDSVQSNQDEEETSGSMQSDQQLEDEKDQDESDDLGEIEGFAIKKKLPADKCSMRSIREMMCRITLGQQNGY